MGGGATILVVDDDASIRALVARVLRRAKYDVSEAGDGHEALEKLRAAPYDVMVLDLMMPVMSGFEVVRYLECHDDAGTPCVVIMSAAAQPAIEQARSPRVHALIRKPFDLFVLLAAVDECTREDAGR